MASRNPQTAAKRAREQALRERRERKRVKKAEAAAEREAAKLDPPAETGDDGEAQPAESADQEAVA